jgi:hypothetical protein
MSPFKRLQSDWVEVAIVLNVPYILYRIKIRGTDTIGNECHISPLDTIPLLTL